MRAYRGKKLRLKNILFFPSKSEGITLKFWWKYLQKVNANRPQICDEKLLFFIRNLRAFCIHFLQILPSESAVDLLSSPIRLTIPYGTSFRISRGFFSIYYLLSVSNGRFLDLSFITAAFITNLINFYKTVLCLIFSGNWFWIHATFFVNKEEWTAHEEF